MVELLFSIVYKEKKTQVLKKHRYDTIKIKIIVMDNWNILNTTSFSFYCTVFENQNK